MSLKGGYSEQGKDIERTETPKAPKPIPDFTPRDLKIRLPNEFNRDKSKLELFLA